MNSLSPSTLSVASGGRDPGSIAGELLLQHGIEDAHVDAVESHLYLRGIASCYKAKRAAARSVAEALPGMVVINELHVVHELSRDESVAAEVAAAIRRTAPDAAASVRVIIVSGNVYLRGTAPDGDVRDRIGAVAWEVPGVMRVHNELSVPEQHVADDELSHELAVYLARVVTIPDGSVSVVYAAGVASLEGEVTSDDKRDMIEELVRWHESVRDVTNNLRVRARPNLS